MKEDFQRQIEELKSQKKRLQGKLNQMSGKIAEDLLASDLQTQKRFRLSDLFDGSVGDENVWNVITVNSRHLQKRPDGKRFEIDIWTESDDQRLLCVEVKKTKTATSPTMVTDFLEKLKWVRDDHPEHQVVGAFLALGGFTEEAQAFCKEHEIATATRLKSIDWFFAEESSTV